MRPYRPRDEARSRLHSNNLNVMTSLFAVIKVMELHDTIQVVFLLTRLRSDMWYQNISPTKWRSEANLKIWQNTFLLADMRLYNPLFGPSVRPLLRQSVTKSLFQGFRSCPSIRDWCYRVYGIVSIQTPERQGRIHGNPVADGEAGAVMQKPLEIQKGYGTDRHSKV